MTQWRAYSCDAGSVYFAGPGADVPAPVRVVRTATATLVPLSFEVWRELRLAGHECPHPILHGYHWPGIWTPRDNQRSTAAFLASHLRAVCLNGMRTGKTYSTLWAADYLMRQRVIKTVLIVAPKSTLEIVWERALLQMHGNSVSWCILNGTRDRKREDCARARQYTIVNPESLHLLVGHIKPDLVVVDEATSMKNPQTRQWKALSKIVGDDLPLWLLTATPTQHSPEDAFGLIRLLSPSYMSAQRWRGMTMQQVSKFKWVPRREAEEVVAQYLRPSIRYTLDDCGDVPTVQKEYLPVAQTPEQERLCKSLVEQAIADVESGERITAVNAGALLSKVLQVQGGGVYVEREGERATLAVDAEPMYQAIEEYVAEADTPVIVFAPFRAVAKAVSERLKCPLFWGDTKQDERRQLCDEFQAGKHDAMVAVADTMSHGLTLNRARYILWVLPPFKAETYAQANGRVLEADSSKRIVITHLVPSQVAKSRYDALESRARLQDTVLELLQQHGG